MDGLDNLWPKPGNPVESNRVKEKQDRDNNLSLLRSQLIEERNKYAPQMQFNFENK